MALKMSKFGYVMCATICVLRSTAVRLRNFDVVFAPLCSLFVPYSYLTSKSATTLCESIAKIKIKRASRTYAVAL